MTELCCPTCDSAMPGCCCACNRELTSDELRLAPDPWEEELGPGITTRQGEPFLLKDHLQCSDCREMSARHI